MDTRDEGPLAGALPQLPGRQVRQYEKDPAPREVEGSRVFLFGRADRI